jgi:hypothetical protein
MVNFHRQPNAFLTAEVKIRPSDPSNGQQSYL